MAVVECPGCHGEAYDNRTLNAKRRAEGKKPMPLIACKDKDGCGYTQWPPKAQSGSNGRSGGNSGNVAKAPKFTWESLEQTYAKCINIGARQAKRVADASKLPLTMADILSAAATCFIAATREGVVEPKPQPNPDASDYA